MCHVIAFGIAYQFPECGWTDAVSDQEIRIIEGQKSSPLEPAQPMGPTDCQRCYRLQSSSDMACNNVRPPALTVADCIPPDTVPVRVLEQVITRSGV